jgi:hypothetical protein
MSIPTQGEEFTKIIEYLRKAQESMAMIAHLERDGNPILAKGWLAWSEQMGNIVLMVTKFAQRGLN